MQSKEISLNKSKPRQPVAVDTPLAKLLVVGSFEAEQITVIRSGAQLALSPELENRVAARRLKLSQNEARARLIDYDIKLRVENGFARQHLVLTVGVVDFATYRETRDFPTFRSLGFADSSAALTIDMAVITSDRQLVTSRKLRGDAAGSKGVPGGGIKVELDEDGNLLPVDILGQGIIEVQEELGLKGFHSGYFTNTRVLAIGHQYGDFCHPYVAGYTEINLTSDELVSQWKQNGDNEIEPVPVPLEDVVRTFYPYSKEGRIIRRTDSEFMPVEPDETLTAALARLAAANKLPFGIIRNKNQI